MNPNRKVFISVVTLLILLLSGCAAGTPSAAGPTASQIDGSPSSAAPSSVLSRTDEQGAVTVTVTPLNLDNPGETLDFDVVLDTHSVELDMDLSALATLTTDSGLSVTATAWTGPGGGHHVEGTLSFPVSLNGADLLAGATRLTLVIRELDAPERTFVWELGG